MDNEGSNVYAIVLAAGRGTRMAEEGASACYPKVLREICGRPVIGYVLDTLSLAGIEDVTVIVGSGAREVESALGKGYRYVHQSEQSGSGHAVACAAPVLGHRTGVAVVMCGDSPLFTPATVHNLIIEIQAENATIALASAFLDDPAGYGRIIRDANGNIERIVEEKGASEEDRVVNEVNGGCYAFDSEWLWANIGRLETNPAGELNLTDLVRVAISDGKTVAASPCDPTEILNVNKPWDLEVVEKIVCGVGEN